MSNRFDNRTKNVFKKQILEAHIREAIIILRLAIKVHAQTGKWPDIKGNGVNYLGEFIEDDKLITAEPDYQLDDRKIEITCSKVVCPKVFHEKVNKINRMTKDGTEMVFVNGLEQVKQPKCLWLNHLEWQPFIEKSKSKYGIVPILGSKTTGFINKSGYRFDLFWFEQANKLFDLPVLICEKKFPDKYREILNFVRCKHGKAHDS